LKAWVLNVKAGDIYSNHCALNGYEKTLKISATKSEN
jgi:hypothetical protein